MLSQYRLGTALLNEQLICDLTWNSLHIGEKEPSFQKREKKKLGMVLDSLVS